MTALSNIDTKMNRDKIRARKRAKYANNPEPQKERSRKYHAFNRAERKAYVMDYYRKNRRVALLRAIRHRAHKKNIPFDLTCDDLVVPKWCPILGIKLDYGSRETRPEVDRIIPALGYVQGNVQVISGRANRLKNDASMAEIEAILRYMRGETL